MKKGISAIGTAHEDDEFEVFSGPNATGSPERRLLTAILERAILDYVGNDKRELEDAQEWIFGEEYSSCAREYSFAWVCQHLDLDPNEIAKLIAAMPKRGNRKIAPWYFANNADSSEKKSEIRTVREDRDKTVASRSIKHTGKHTSNCRLALVA